jgi:hypothetical protein
MTDFALQRPPSLSARRRHPSTNRIAIGALPQPTAPRHPLGAQGANAQRGGGVADSVLRNAA